MTVRLLFLGEGTSDAGILPFVEERALLHQRSVASTAPDLDLVTRPGSRSVLDKLATALELGAGFDCVIIHRDVDNRSVDERLSEMRDAVCRLSPDLPLVPMIAVRMTEAWLLLDEQSIRFVAGNPEGRMDLSLPTPAEAERMADPKQALKTALLAAADVAGRRLRTHTNRFPLHRRRLLETLEDSQRMRQLQSWSAFVDQLDDVLKGLSHE